MTFLGHFMKNIKNTMVFHYFGRVQTGQPHENPPPPRGAPRPGVAHFVRFVALGCCYHLLAREAEASSVLSGILCLTHSPEPSGNSLRSLALLLGSLYHLLAREAEAFSVLSGIRSGALQAPEQAC